jgi:integrase
VLSVAVRNWWLTPQAARLGKPDDDQDAALKWLERASLPVAHLDVDEAERVLARLNVKRDGSPVAAATFTRRRGAFYSALEFGVKRRQLKENPLDRSEWKPEKQHLAIDVQTVMSVTECRDAQRLMKQLAPRYEVVVALHWLGGLRPSEIAHLTVNDVTLPKTGWGTLRLTGATVTAGKRWTDGHTTVQRKGLKARADKHVRMVPIPQELVKTLRRHIDDNNLTGRDLLVTSPRGGPLNYSSVGAAWQKVREQMFPANHRLRETRLYDLRHSNATILLTSGVPVAVVAARLGHSPAVCMRIYQGILSGYDDIANTAVDKFLASNK